MGPSRGIALVLVLGDSGLPCRVPAGLDDPAIHAGHARPVGLRSLRLRRLAPSWMDHILLMYIHG